MSCETTYKVRNSDYRCTPSLMLNYITFTEVRNHLQAVKTRLALNSIFTQMTRWVEEKVGARFCFIPLRSRPCRCCLISMYQCNPTKQCLGIILLHCSTRLSETIWKTFLYLPGLWGQSLQLQFPCSSPWPFPHLSPFAKW